MSLLLEFYNWSIDNPILFILSSPLQLALLYPLAIQYERGGLWYIVLPVTIYAFLIDLIAKTFVLSFLFIELPFKHSTYFNRREFTFSDSLERYVLNTGWRGKIAVPIAKVLNYFAPYKHIKNL